MSRHPSKNILLLLFIVQLAFKLHVVECRSRHAHHQHHQRDPQFGKWLSSMFPGFGNRARAEPARPPTPGSPPTTQAPTSSSVTTTKPVAVLPTQTSQATLVSQTFGASSTAQPPTTSAFSSVTTPLPTMALSSASQMRSAPAITSLFTSAKPLPTGIPGTACSTLRVRKEWRNFSRQEQINYISAVKCLANNPSQLLPDGDYSRYDDFQSVHSRMRSRIHWIASFLPWHRHFMFLFEQALQKECGYAGNLPRWDWTLDSANMTKAPIWSSDPQTGFGGNGRDFSDNSAGLNAGIVQDGAFANWPLYYPNYHLLQRNYNLPARFYQAGRSWGSQYFDSKAVAIVQSRATYAEFAVAIEGTDPMSTGPSNPGPHSIIHVIIGGDISPSSYAANEPLFYLHHANVDYHWWQWQNSPRSNRLNAYGGPATRGSHDDAQLTDHLELLGISEDVTVAQTMDTHSYPYCYRYE